MPDHNYVSEKALIDLSQSKTEFIAINEITVEDRVRNLDAGWVEALADDVVEKGQLQAVGVRKVKGGFALIFGEHRIEALKVLGKEFVEAKILPVTEAQAKVIEIDENILRMPFSPLSFAHALRRRKEIYEEAFPQSKHGAKGLIAMNSPEDDNHSANVGVLDDGQVAKDCHLGENQQSFSVNTAERLGVSPRKIRDAIWLSFHLTRNAEITLSDHKIMDNASQLHSLAKLPPEDQEVAAELIAAGTCKNVSEADAFISGKVAPTASVKAFNKVVETYAKTDASTKAQIIETLARHGLPAGYSLLINGEELK